MLIPQGLRLVHSGSVAQANMKLASIDAGAMIDIGVDWSAYAGDDAGSTPYMLVLYDSAGKRLQGFIGASGGGLAYGAELLVNGDFTNWTGDDPDSWIVSAEDANNYVTQNPAGQAQTVASGSASLYQNIITSSKLIYVSIDITAHVSGHIRITDGTRVILSKSIIATHIIYATGTGTRIYQASVGVTNITTDNVSVKQVTDVSVQGVHLHSTRGGINRNVASIDSGFDLNDSSGYTFKLYKCP